jgi:hypothetical protein
MNSRAVIAQSMTHPRAISLRRKLHVASALLSAAFQTDGG